MITSRATNEDLMISKKLKKIIELQRQSNFSVVISVDQKID